MAYAAAAAPEADFEKRLAMVAFEGQQRKEVCANYDAPPRFHPPPPTTHMVFWKV
jgi:hypothetical protein